MYVVIQFPANLVYAKIVTVAAENAMGGTDGIVRTRRIMNGRAMVTIEGQAAGADLAFIRPSEATRDMCLRLTCGSEASL